MKLFVTLLALLALLAGDSCALDADNYTAYIEQLSLDEQFVEEYAKWSFELFSQPDYLYGARHKKFPCSLANSSTVPTSVHALRPSDVRCIGAMGDSLTAGLGAHAHTPIGLLFENRGVSWSVGGDHTYSKILSIPNALRQYTPKLDGYSTKVSVMFLNGQNAKHNRLNVAKSGDRSNNMPFQADLLISRLKEDQVCNWDNDWKVITFFVGGNDLCSFCEDPNVTKHTPEFYLSYVRDALDKLYNAPLRRTLINLVLVLDVRGVKDLNSGGFVCQVLHKRTCPCAAFPTPEQAKILENYVPRYHQVLIDLVDSGRYDGRDDFTVVVQPFLAKTKIPLKDNHKIDFSYFAPDCFHFSGKGHSQAALSLWNNMLEPVGAKQWAWHMGEELKCPTEQYPYIFTKKNSAKALEEYQHSTAAATSTTARASSTEGSSTATHHRRHKHRKSDSDSLLSKSQFTVFVGCFFLLVVLLILAMTKRQQIRIFMHKKGRQHLSGFQNPEYPDDADDVEIWTRPGGKAGLSSSDAIPKTHGTRISFE